MTPCLRKLPEAQQRHLRAGNPGWRQPMLATLTNDRFSSPDWLYERKLDGERALAVRRGGEVRLYSRNEHDITRTYPELAEVLAREAGPDLVLDGEIVAFEGRHTRFSRLQQRMQVRDARSGGTGEVAVYLYAFDLLHLDGQWLEALPLRTRKSVLRCAVSFDGRLRYTPHRNETGETYHAEACRKGWEGVIAKRADAPYRHDRSRDWLKFKCGHRQELVIGGFTAPHGQRPGFGALLLGYYEGGQLRYAGKVGTGFDDAFLERFRKRMDGLARKASPFADPVRETEVTWVAPKLVGEVGFTEWTTDHRLRHPRFLGLRRDKAPEDVHRERGD